MLPVRLPQGPGRRSVLEHYLRDPACWHKVDLVRHRDPAAPGGWRYEAHLLVLGPGYTAPGVVARRAAAAGLDRRGGVDVNVSNLAVVSVPTGLTDLTDSAGLAGSAFLDAAGGGLVASRLTRAAGHEAALAVDRLRQRRRNRALQRSRRAANPAQYQLSERQQRRAERRAAAGLAAVHVSVPGGARVANAAGVPVRAHRRDDLSNSYLRLRAQAVVDGAARTAAGRTRARIMAADLVAVHGARLTVEDGDIRHWARRWGRGIHAFTPGMLLHALDREVTAVAALRSHDTETMAGTVGLLRAGTRHTAWTQHCLCGNRVPKQLRDRRHTCPTCGLHGDRDLVAALVGAHTALTDPNQPGTAHIDWTATRYTLDQYGVEAINQGLQGALTESTGTPRPDRHHTSARTRRPQRSTHPSGRTGQAEGCRRARRTTGTSHSTNQWPVPSTTPDETNPAPADRTTPERRAAHPGLLDKTDTKPDKSIRP